MRIKANNLIFLALILFAILIPSEARGDSATSEEYQIKAAFLYNFVKFIDWPEEKMGKGDEPITIGIMGKDPFGEAFKPLKYKQIKGKHVVIKRFKGLKELEEAKGKKKSEKEKQIEDIKKCHLLFICRSEKQKLNEILDMIKGHNVLTVGDAQGFLEAGSIIEFIMVDRKVRFGINVAAAREAELTIRSQLLRLAEKIIKEQNQTRNK